MDVWEEFLSSRCGVYCAANACIEQVIQHGEVDVFQAVKTVRRHRPQLVENLVGPLKRFIFILWHLFFRLNTSTAMTWCSTMCFTICIKNKQNDFLLSPSHPLVRLGILDHCSPSPAIPPDFIPNAEETSAELDIHSVQSFWNFIITDKVRILSESNQCYIFLSTVLFLRWNFSINFTCQGLIPCIAVLSAIFLSHFPVLFKILCCFIFYVWVSFLRHDNFYIE